MHMDTSRSGIQTTPISSSWVAIKLRLWCRRPQTSSNTRSRTVLQWIPMPRTDTKNDSFIARYTNVSLTSTVSFTVTPKLFCHIRWMEFPWSQLSILLASSVFPPRELKAETRLRRIGTHVPIHDITALYKPEDSQNLLVNSVAFGSALAKQFSRAGSSMQDHNVVLMANHGFTTIGTSIKQAVRSPGWSPFQIFNMS